MLKDNKVYLLKSGTGKNRAKKYKKMQTKWDLIKEISKRTKRKNTITIKVERLKNTKK